MERRRIPQNHQSVRYGDLLHGQQDLLHGQQLVKLIPDDPPLASPETWKIAGGAVPKVDGREFVTGKRKRALCHNGPREAHPANTTQAKLTNNL
jgi:hypothetical protein